MKTYSDRSKEKSNEATRSNFPFISKSKNSSNTFFEPRYQSKNSTNDEFETNSAVRITASGSVNQFVLKHADLSDQKFGIEEENEGKIFVSAGTQVVLINK